MSKVLNLFSKLSMLSVYLGGEGFKEESREQRFSRKAAAGEVRGSRNNSPGQNACAKCKDSLHLVQFVRQRGTGTMVWMYPSY